MAVFWVPVVLLKSAAAPVAVLLSPVLKRSVPEPLAVLALPLALANSALAPLADVVKERLVAAGSVLKRRPPAVAKEGANTISTRALVIKPSIGTQLATAILPWAVCFLSGFDPLPTVRQINATLTAPRATRSRAIHLPASDA